MCRHHSRAFDWIPILILPHRKLSFGNSGGSSGFILTTSPLICGNTGDSASCGFFCRFLLALAFQKLRLNRSQPKNLHLFDGNMICPRKRLKSLWWSLRIRWRSPSSTSWTKSKVFALIRSGVHSPPRKHSGCWSTALNSKSSGIPVRAHGLSNPKAPTSPPMTQLKNHRHKHSL